MSLKDTLLIGCIADDFTGASDAASFLAKGGLVTVLCDGIPQNLEHCEGCQAIVIALKTRSVEKELAVDESLHALHFLQEAGAKSFYFKYCSLTSQKNSDDQISIFLLSLINSFCKSVPFHRGC